MKAKQSLRMVDRRTFTLVALAFGLGVMLVAWHGKSLMLEVEGTNLTWVVLIGFGMTWHGEWGTGLRMSAGLILGTFGATLAYFGAFAFLPITPFSLGLGLGVVATCVALVTHVFPRFFSFAGAAVGYAVGISASRALPLNAFRHVDQVAALILTAVLCLVLGVAGSLALRALLVLWGEPRTTDRRSVRDVVRMLQLKDDVKRLAARPRPRVGAVR
jgi:hypothetical protein